MRTANLNGNTYPLSDLFEIYQAGKAVDGAAASEYGTGLVLPRKGSWNYEGE